MRSKGLECGKIEQKPITHLIDMVIIPSITHLMEVTRLSDRDTNKIDRFFSNMLTHTHKAPKGPNTPAIWTIMEEDMTPPSILIEANSLMMYHKIINKQGGSVVLKTLKRNGKSHYTQTVKAILK